MKFIGSAFAAACLQSFYDDYKIIPVWMFTLRFFFPPNQTPNNNRETENQNFFLQNLIRKWIFLWAIKLTVRSEIRKIIASEDMEIR